MDIVKKIDELRESKGWSYYKLSQESGLSQQTFTKWKEGNTIPTVHALELVCDAFGITLAQFFSDIEIAHVPKENNSALKNWKYLSTDEQYSIELIINNYIKNKK